MTLTNNKKKRKTKIKKIPFGYNVPRFLFIGIHPKFDTRSGTYKYPNIFPGCHDWSRTPKIVSKIPNWKRCLEIEEFSKRLAYHGEHIVKQRQWDKSVNGPGWQNVPPAPTGRQVTFLKNKRFPKAKTNSFPGPGTYGKYHDPFTRKEEKSWSKGFSFSTIMPFDGKAERPKSLDPQPSYHLPPNLYTLKTCFDEMIAKRISKRGPYDLFTGPRFQKLIVPKHLDKKEMPPPRIDPDDYSHPKNAFKGKFMKCGKDNIITNRMMLNDSKANTRANPGPNYYEPFPPETVNPALYPFNSSIAQVRPRIKKELQPPPGRYNPDRKKRIKGDGLKSAFISKTKRVMPLAPKWSWFD